MRITDSAIVAAAVLSQRYIPDRFLPDKAVDLVDEAASLSGVSCIGVTWYYLSLVANNLKTVFLLGLLTGAILFIGSFSGLQGLTIALLNANWLSPINGRRCACPRSLHKLPTDLAAQSLP